MKYLEVGLWSESRGWRSHAWLFRDHCTISQCDRFAGNRRHALAGYNYSDQIQWVGGGEGDGFAGGRDVARGAQRFQRHWQGELLAQEAVHKAATSHLATILEAPERNQQFAPFERELLAQGQFSKYHTVTLQQHAANRLEGLGAIRRLP
jgi:hypothetical protein